MHGSAATLVTRIIACIESDSSHHPSSVNPYTLLVTTQYGGHIGWFTGWLRPRYWFARVVMHFCDALSKVSCQCVRSPFTSLCTAAG